MRRFAPHFLLARPSRASREISAGLTERMFPSGPPNHATRAPPGAAQRDAAIPQPTGGRCRLREGASTLLMAKAYPKSQFLASTITTSRSKLPVSRRGRASHRVSFEISKAKEYPGKDYDFVDGVRLPARHGRSNWGGSARPAAVDKRWHVDDR